MKIFKSFLLAALICITVIGLIGCGATVKENSVINEPNNEVEEQNIVIDEENNDTELNNLSNEEMYSGLINDYKKSLDEYDLEDVDADEKATKTNSLINPNLLMHIARYADNGTELTFKYYDIDKNGIDELLVGASDAIGAIYSYNKETMQPVKIFFQSTLERGNLSIYDNGVIFSEGSGGAALHYYEFGLLGTDGVTYQLAESIEEEYVEESEVPVYRNAENGEELEYKSLDEITNKYIGDAKTI